MDRAVEEGLGHGGNGCSDLKRKRAVKCAAYLARLQSHWDVLRRQWPSPSAAVVSHGRGCGCCSGKSVTDNYMNFLKSGLPRRIMFFSQGEWREFPAHVIGSLADAFGSKTSALEVMLGGRLCLVDFVRMVLIDLRNGLLQSIAWIDQSERCFFPKFSFDGSNVKNRVKCGYPKVAHAAEIEVKLEIEISGADSSKPGDLNHVPVSCANIVNAQQSSRHSPDARAIGEGDAMLPEVGACGRQSSCLRDGVQEFLMSEALGDKVIALDRGSSDYIGVCNAFLIGLGACIRADDIVGIFRHSPTCRFAQKRMRLFEDQVQIMNNYRGDANVRYAWYGSSREGILEIMLYGFGRIQKPMNGMAYGNGVHLWSKEFSHISASYCDIDEKGMQHMVLSRVIMGNMEQIPLGSEQFYPSNENFDSGVDDLGNPKHFVIWCTHMNMHILPEYVVSFKVPLVDQEYCAELKGNHNIVGSAAVTDFEFADSYMKRLSLTADLGSSQEPVKQPTSTLMMPFPLLFAAMEKYITTDAKKVLDQYYDDYKRERLTRADLIKKLRLVTGDDLLRTTLQTLQSDKFLPQREVASSNTLQEALRGQKKTRDVLWRAGYR